MKRFLLLTLSSLCSFTILSQNIQNDLSLVPPSPEMATLGSYGGFDVDHYTGRANVSIPIYEIKLPDFSLPISLSYNTGGHRVEEIASWVGLGWSLNAGGLISRTVFGLPDNQSDGYMDELVYSTAKEIIDLPPTTDKDFALTDAHNGDFDTEPDIFHYGFAGHSGEFYFNQETRKIVFVPMNNLWVNQDLFITSGIWHIKDERGVEYFFEKEETNLTYVSCDGGASSPDNYESGWYITKIITPIERTEILFKYSSIIYQVQNPSTHILNSGNGTNGFNCANQQVRCNSYNQFIGFSLSSIEWKDSKIELEAETERLDLPSTNQLDRIKVYENSGTAIGTFHFGYEYNYPNPESKNPDEIRLKLRSITEEGLNGTTKPPYIFDYDYEKKLPSRFSYAQDIWGYYNGVHNNSHLVPPLQDGSLSTLSLNGGADRRANSDFTAADVLKKITYPTGGYTLLEYENHKLRTIDAPEFGGGENVAQRSNYVNVLDRVGTSETFESDVFTIYDVFEGGAFVDIWFSIDSSIGTPSSCEFCEGATSCFQFMVVGVTDSSQTFIISCPVIDQFLPNGDYKLTADFSGNTDGATSYDEFTLAMNWSERLPPEEGPLNVSVGGLRIASIKDVASDHSETVTKYDYTKNKSGQSSGKLLNPKAIFERMKSCMEEGPNPAESFYVERSAKPLQPISSSRSPVVYEQVGISNFSDSTIQKTIYKFSFNYDFEPEIDLYGTTVYLELPYVNVSMEYRRGLLLEQSNYRWIGTFTEFEFDGQGHPYIFEYDSFQIANRKIFEYTHADNNLYMDGEFSGEGSNSDGTFGIRTGMTCINLPGQYAEGVAYKVLSEFIKPKKETTITYENDRELTTTVRYFYDNPDHRLPTKIVSSRSDGLENVQKTTYPEDIEVPAGSSDPYAAGVASLQDKHILAQPIEIVNKLFNPADSSEEFLNATLQLFLPSSSGNVSVKSLSKSSSFQPVSFDANGDLLWDSSYETELDIIRENGSGRVLQTITKDGVITSYIWGYDKQVIIGVIAGVDYQTLTKPPFDLNIHTSYHDLYIEGFMDDWREEFPEAQITSYIYTDDLKLTSQTDPNGKKTIYEYDDLRRLKAIRNNDQEIIRSFDYFYKN